jgi:hypothetical protein
MPQRRAPSCTPTPSVTAQSASACAARRFTFAGSRASGGAAREHLRQSPLGFRDAYPSGPAIPGRPSRVVGAHKPFGIGSDCAGAASTMTVQTLPLGAVVVTANGNVVRCIAWVERDRRRAIAHASGGADHRSALVRRIDAGGREALTIAAALAGESDIAFWARSRCIQSVRRRARGSAPGAPRSAATDSAGSAWGSVLVSLGRPYYPMP